MLSNLKMKSLRRLSLKWHDEEEFKEIQKHWYQKLAEAGFKDIESPTTKWLPGTFWHSSHFRTQYTPDAFEAKEEYYRLASQFLFSYKFKTFREKVIWKFHSEGISVREIAARLQRNSQKINKDKVNQIILHLIEEMKAHDFERDVV